MATIESESNLKPNWEKANELANEIVQRMSELFDLDVDELHQLIINITREPDNTFSMSGPSWDYRFTDRLMVVTKEYIDTLKRE